jgi:hypothetical protein
MALLTAVGPVSAGNKKNKHVLEPSVFLDDISEGWTVVHRRRWSPAISKKVLE